MWIENLWQSVRLLHESILPLLERPAIQRQIVAAALIFILAWFVSVIGSRALRKGGTPDTNQGGENSDTAGRLPSSLYRLMRVLSQIYLPVFGILFGALAIRFFSEKEWLFGLLQQFQIYFVLLLIYRIIVASVYFFFSERQAQRYHARFLKPLFFLAIIMSVSQLLSGVVVFADQRLFTVSERNITIGSLFSAGVVFYLFLAISWLLQDLLTYLILPRFIVEKGMANTILTVSRYIIIAAGILGALAMLGINLATLAIIGAGLSVGIGFGLQELVANFISGVLLLFEQSIRPGDVVEINGNLGTVERLRIRSTTIRTRDNVEIIVPNQNLLTSSVTTYTHTERLIRLNIGVGVSYDSEPTEVRDALLSAGRRHGLVKKRPEPTVFFEEFGDSSLDFKLAIWIENAELIRIVSSDLRFIIWEELAKRNIEIPFPQRDLHIRSGVPWESLNNTPASTNGQSSEQSFKQNQ